MPLEVSSLLSRLRFRPSNHSVVPATALAEDPNILCSHDSVTKPQLDQRILHNPDTYIDSGDSSQPPIGTADNGAGLPHPRRTRYNPEEQVPKRDTHGQSLAYTQSTRAYRLAHGGETFGKKSGRRARSHTPRSSHRKATRSLSWKRHLHDQDHADEGIPSDNTVLEWDALNAANQSRPSIASCEALPSSRSAASARESHCSRSTSRNSSPADALSSSRRPRIDHTAGLSLSSHVHSTTPSSRHSCFDSPRTFGHPTPPDNTSAFKPACQAPPLPPLNHPELAAALAARNKAASTMQPTSSDRSNIPRRRSSQDPLALMPSTFTRARGKRASFPGIREVFDTEIQEQQREPQMQQTSDRRRARTVSGRPQNLRRDSAEWIAQQAVSGVTSCSDQTWPAEVSREILRMALGEEAGTGGGAAEGVSGSSAEYKSQTRGHSMHDFPDRAPIPPHSSLFPSTGTPPPERDSGLPKGPAALPDPIPIATRIRRASTSLLRHSFGHRRHSGLGGLSMAQVMRSQSAIESRHDPRRATNVSYEPSSSSLGRSASATTPPARSQLLHAYSAVTPSRPILHSPSTPNICISRAADEAPATPTPAPKYPSDKSRGKRKADDIDTTPPELKKEGQRATFVIPPETRSQRISNSSHAPSSYGRKRARLSSVSPFGTPAHSRPPSIQEQSVSHGHQLAWPSNTTSGRGASPCTPSRGASVRSHNPSQQQSPYRKSHDRRQSMSQTSIPISALVSPHAPSVTTSSKFHMRDPRRPPKKLKDTEWSLRFATDDEPGSPSQAWLFFMGFILFPLWWIAAFCMPVPKTRTAGDANLEKAVTVIDDPQIEHDAKSWRLRCRVMAVVSAFTYIPFIALVAIFARR